MNSLRRAEALSSAGKLERRLLFPLEFGGQDKPRNVLHDPPGMAAIKQRIDRIVQDLVNQGQVRKYEAHPEYKGGSFIPSKIRIPASHHE